jgi:hypothetical protein
MLAEWSARLSDKRLFVNVQDTSAIRQLEADEINIVGGWCSGVIAPKTITHAQITGEQHSLAICSACSSTE